MAQQRFAMKSMFPTFIETVAGQVITWVGDLRPTPLSEQYTIRIEYKQGDFPNVDVLSPQLRTRGSDPIPHTYRADRLCLFLPRANEWHRNLLIASTIVPWTSLWLYYYEMWHATGEWHGGGEHPQRPQREEKQRDA